MTLHPSDGLDARMLLQAMLDDTLAAEFSRKEALVTSKFYELFAGMYLLDGTI